MKRNILIVFGLVFFSTVCFITFNNLKTNAQVKKKPSANSNQWSQSNTNKSNFNQAFNSYQGNALVSNTGEQLVLPKTSGSEITILEDLGVTFVFPKGYEIYDVAKMYDYEKEDPNRLFDTRAHLHSLDSDWGIDLMIHTGHNLSFEECVKNARQLIIGDRGYKVLRSGIKSRINGFEVVSSSGVKEQEIWTIDAIKTPGGALMVVAIGFPKEMQRNKANIQSLVQSIKLK